MLVTESDETLKAALEAKEALVKEMDERVEELKREIGASKEESALAKKSVEEQVALLAEAQGKLKAMDDEKSKSCSGMRCVYV